MYCTGQDFDLYFTYYLIFISFEVISKFWKKGLDDLGLDVQNMIERIGERNCAWDDRVISDSGAEYTLPFLDLDFIKTGQYDFSQLRASFISKVENWYFQPMR